MTRTHPSPAPLASTAPTAGASEAGSAYLVAILALVVLTIAGLSLALITQTEMQIGANEKMIERAFYAADSGISLATAASLVARAGAEGNQYILQDPEGGGLELEHYVVTTPFYPISDSFCPVTDIANQGQYEQSWARVNHAVNSTAVRRVPGSDSPLAERSLGAMVELQCLDYKPDALKAANNPELLPRY
jgi:hypothetical protein